MFLLVFVLAELDVLIRCNEMIQCSADGTVLDLGAGDLELLSVTLFDLQRKYPRTCQWLPYLSCWLLGPPQRQMAHHSWPGSDDRTSQKQRATDSRCSPGLESDEALTDRGTSKTPDDEHLSTAGPTVKASDDGSTVSSLRVDQGQSESGMLSSAELNLRVEEALQLQVLTL